MHASLETVTKVNMEKLSTTGDKIREELDKRDEIREMRSER